jgi:hypothetical protein
VSYGQTVFANQENIAYIRANANNTPEIFLSPEVRRLIDLSQPVAIGLNAVILFLSAEDGRKLAQALYDWAPVGSKIFIVFQTRGEGEPPEAYERFKALCRSAGLPIELHTYSDSAAIMQPWQPVDIKPIVEFLDLPKDFINPEDETEMRLAFYAVFLEK